MTEQSLLPNEETIIVGLGERGLPHWGAPIVAPQIAALRSPLREAFLQWWQTGEVPDVEVQGQNARALVDLGLHPLAALLSLDALEQDPMAVKARLHRGRENFVPVLLGSKPTIPSGENS